MRAAFVGMQGRIDPPSSLGDLTVERLSQTASEAEVWVATTKAQTTEFGLIVGTVILTRKDKVLGVGKLAVRDRRTGLGSALMALAEEQAQGLVDLSCKAGWSWLRSMPRSRRLVLSR